MHLDQLLHDVDVVDVRGDPAAVEVSGVTHDSRAVTAGSLFCCVPGTAADGHDHAGDAVSQGAAALLCERLLPLDVAQVQVAAARPAMAAAAAAFHGHPSRTLEVVGVTGTNGKTTTTHLLGAVLAADGRSVEVVGTLTGPRTTPEATDLQALLARCVDRGVGAVAMEVSSHALAQHRVDATRFAVVAFTNLSRDHLEYHGTMEEYFRCKASLFEPGRAEVGVVNADDAHGRRLLGQARIPVRPYSLADAGDVQIGLSASTFSWRGARVRLGLGGRFNVLNALAAASVASEMGVSAPVVAEGLSAATPVPGRFELVDAGQPFTVVVDFAHTADGLEQALGAVRASAAAGARVIVVFGCGGDRDPGKRAPMGEAAARLADLAVVTSDNPRSEDPGTIIAQVVEGAAGSPRLVVEADRARAIEMALAEARPGDVVVVAGKGHETGQEIAGKVLPFDDRQVARAAVERLAARGLLPGGGSRSGLRW